MKEYKASTILLLLSSLLILSLVVVMCIWGYNFYYKDKGNQSQIINNSTVQPLSITTATRDSLQVVYNTAIQTLGDRFDSTWTSADSAKSELDIKLSEFYKLRNEIALLLKGGTNNTDIILASQKITELQLKVNELRNRTNDVEQENKKLHALLQQLSKGNTTAISPEQNSLPAKTVSYQQPVKTNAIAYADNDKDEQPIFIASNLKLSALADKDKETTKAEEAEKIVGSFTVKNATNQYNGTEVMVIVLQPNGQILRNSPWESGMFDTKEDGKRVYSCRLRFDYNKGELKRCNFSINADEYQKGTYTFQIYHNGIMIANMTKTLS